MFLDNKWSRDTIDKLIENYHIEYITTASESLNVQHHLVHLIIYK